MAAKNRKAKNKKRPKRRKPTATAFRNPERLARRVARVRPVAWKGESSVDAAVFDDAVLDELEPEIAAEVRLVREALAMVADPLAGDVNQRLSTISRRSPLSEWRLLLRGLVSWYANRTDEAQESWKRLDRERRPSRIAAALTASGREDLDALISAAGTGSLGEQAISLGWDSSILSAARLVRQTRVDRLAVQEAVRETSLRERLPAELAKRLLLSPARLAWVIEFCSQYNQLEPQLVDAVKQAALDRAMKQPFADLNRDAMSKLAGPLHDPKNLLSQAIYHGRFADGDVQADSFMQQYLTKSLPNNKQISPSLRAAIESEIYLDQAREEASPGNDGSLYARLFAEPVDHKLVAKLYKKALAAYPANAEAHREYVDWIREYTDNDRRRKSEREPFEKLLLPAMKAWAAGVPEEIEPRLWLVDFYLENEELDAAQPHVQWLAGSRHADPRVRATPWKWELLEAMRLCRRKAWLADVPAKLDAAEKLWPVWLSKDWLPYLHAALRLRQGQTAEYEAARGEIRNQRQAAGRPLCNLTDAAMMLAAAQRMRVPAAELKPLRATIDAAVKDAENLDDADLIQTASFFWDLHRANLLYPAYRMHGGKFAAELYRRLNPVEKGGIGSFVKEPNFTDAIYWLVIRRCFTDGYDIKLPPTLSDLLSDLARAVLSIESLLSNRNQGRWRIQKHEADIEVLRAAAAMEKDPYYRYWFSSLTSRGEAAISANTSLSDGFGSFDPFDSYESDEDEFDDDEDAEECDCEFCRNERAQAAASAAFSEAAMDQEDDEFAPYIDPRIDPPLPSRPRIDLPSDPDFKRTRPKDPMGKKRKKNRR